MYAFSIKCSVVENRAKQTSCHAATRENRVWGFEKVQQREPATERI
jgi:hypothetical protein